jgi:hypothetical protein
MDANDPLFINIQDANTVNWLVAYHNSLNDPLSRASFLRIVIGEVDKVLGRQVMEVLYIFIKFLMCQLLLMQCLASRRVTRSTQAIKATTSKIGTTVSSILSFFIYRDGANAQSQLDIKALLLNPTDLISNLTNTIHEHTQTPNTISLNEL